MGKKTIEEWAKAVGTSRRWFAVAKAANQWPTGFELTLDEYETGIAKGENTQVGGPSLAAQAAAEDAKAAREAAAAAVAAKKAEKANGAVSAEED